ncbi:hypothetical protein CLNEO_24190 [Anaerotignum neopropionicum]|uniref:Uncharacterized protein n=1 Tax=Anaerotignum neopropionicum TaxID=36847 RepID=A0A136WCN0_9FIRM|nr:hypothetical protein [Anaerotignum neopropionicum]KXL52254.1 hypothetical protein CLNEO_24190 [Anaerotignum neopropionicum]
MVDILIPNLQELKSMQLETVDADSLIAKVKAGITIQEEEVKKYEWNFGSMQL